MQSENSQLDIFKDPDKFMKDNGYVTTEVIGRKFGVTAVTVRGWITAGRLKDSDHVTIGDRIYIREDIEKPTQDRSKRGSRKGRYSYGTSFR